MNEELLFVMLFLGFLFLFTSLVGTWVSKALPSPKAGAEPMVMEVA
jgi:Na+-transporting methylmalonyl-CoA/oxaloacetate decarboxylase gamma subunit